MASKLKINSVDIDNAIRLSEKLGKNIRYFPYGFVALSYLYPSKAECIEVYRNGKRIIVEYDRKRNILSKSNKNRFFGFPKKCYEFIDSDE